ncbi:hypothetical protein SETIT_8G204900v2 [Setaria italica]|uniref:AAA+ ATPase domain-containing protein n=2 Tax=Setaria italica TaxID=4555 RepID=A0A368S9U9_SETIT|nr:AAA-ATPase ASD, mitochondrial [Setaria italica]RCV39209.1 hypothetical protein SETIT_8G204900v2 [Setaria italica]
MAAKDLWTAIGSTLAFILALCSMAMHQAKIILWINKIVGYFNPYIQITIPEYGADRFQRSDFFVAIEAYLSHKCASQARKLKADLGNVRKKPQASVDDGQEIIDNFDGAMLWWYAAMVPKKYNVISLSPGDDERRYYRLSFHRSFRDKVLDSYLPHVLEKGRAVISENRQRRLFTKNPSSRWSSYSPKTIWSHVPFEHPAKFDTLAMNPDVKEDIMDDLRAFQEAKDYYTKVGKAWKRGYLLFGPPGTGKSTMIAAMANFLDYDVYDLELTAVKNNTELRQLFIETTAKSIIVIEDIDCSVDLTGKRKDKKVHKKKSSSESESSDNVTRLPIEAKEDDESTKLTLSGVLNFIDGLWSACGGERIIIFTTNNKDKLDPALIRRGRMDKHIEMSYCRYEAFKLLASNYLQITEHEFFEQFGEIQQLLEEIDMSPADVAENLMPMSTKKKDPGMCLAGLVVALKNAKVDAAAKVMEEAKKEEDAEKSMDKEEAVSIKVKEDANAKEKETEKSREKEEAVTVKVKEEGKEIVKEAKKFMEKQEAVPDKVEEEVKANEKEEKKSMEKAEAITVEVEDAKA